jgi:endonuclease/exonuclease/phosphatase family metal-dependent hydrolase
MKKYFLSVIILMFTFGELSAKQNEPIIVATYNLRFNNPNDGLNSWPYRKEHVKALIRYHGFDIFGTEEGLIGMLKDLSEMKEYAFIGKGRDDGKEAGEHSAIFYRKSRFALLKKGDFWLSETPDKPSYGWDARGNRRICSWGEFKDKDSGTKFYFFCVHFDDQGEIARRESAKLMIKKIKEIAGSSPVFCVGDFNSTPETEQINTMKTLLHDSRDVTVMPPYGPIGTFEGFNFEAPLKDRIDYIFVNNQIRVLKYGVLTDSYDCRYFSDHLPVAITAIIKQ